MTQSMDYNSTIEEENIDLKMKICSFAEKFIEKENEFLEKIENLQAEIESEITQGIRQLLDNDEETRYKL